jgi:glycerol 2-dehydrogenase (NADP+)
VAKKLTDRIGNHEKFPKHPDGSRDLVLDHSHITTWKSLEKLVATGKVKAIGVCNYSVKYLNDLLPHATIIPAVNQIENHPQLPQDDVVELCKSKGIHITAYSPLGSTGSPLFTRPEVQEVAKKHGVEVGTVLLSYHIARGSSVLAKSVNPVRIEANQKLIKLDEEDLKTLATIAVAEPKRYVYPEFGVNFGFPDKDTGIVLVK